MWLPFHKWTQHNPLTVLVNEHAERNAVGIKTVQEILDVTANEWIKPELFLVFYHALGHCRNNIVVSVSDINQNMEKAAWEGNKVVSLYFIDRNTLPPLSSYLLVLFIRINTTFTR